MFNFIYFSFFFIFGGLEVKKLSGKCMHVNSSVNLNRNVDLYVDKVMDMHLNSF